MGRRALVTGAARGIGRAIVTELLTAGHDVVATHRHTPVPADLAGTATWRELDVRDGQAVEALVDADGPFDIVVTNAAVLRDHSFAGMTDEAFVDVLDTDLGGARRVIRAALPGMVGRGWGRVVALTSAGAQLGSAGQANYVTAKAALNGWVSGIATEVAAAGVTVNAVAPGPIDTELLRELGPRRLDAMAATVPAGRLGRPEEVAAVVGFIVSERASFLTGVVIPVDGGLVHSGAWGRSVRDLVLRQRGGGA